MSSTSRRRMMLWRKGVRQCARCGEALAGPDQATLDHIVPQSAGGQTTRDNLTLSHAECNRAAGRRLWLERQHGQEPRAAAKRPVTATFWYESLRVTSLLLRVPRPRDEAFQIIGAIEASVTIAERSGIREVAELKKKYGKGSWLKRKGRAVVRLDDGSIRRAELRWYEAHGIGRREVKIKRFLDL